MSSPPIASSCLLMVAHVDPDTGRLAVFCHTSAGGGVIFDRTLLDGDWHEQERRDNEQVRTNFVLPFSSNPPTKYRQSPQIVADANARGWGRLSAVDHCSVSVSIISTVARLSWQPPTVAPPATIREFRLHTTAAPWRLVGMGGNISNHLFPLPSQV